MMYDVLMLTLIQRIYQISERFLPIRGRYRAMQALVRPFLGTQNRVCSLFRTSARIWADPADAIERAVLLTGVWEKRETDFFDSMLKPGMNVMDIGAHAGIHSMRFGYLVGRSGVVYSFEPNPDAAARFRKNTELNPHLNIRLTESALGSQAGSANIFVASRNKIGCMLKGQAEVSEASGESVAAVLVPVVTLDSMWREFGQPRIDFIKIDVEGYEYHVLKGGLELLASCRPVICFEHSEVYARMSGIGWSDIARTLNHVGYAIFDMNGNEVTESFTFSSGANVDLIARPV